MKFFLSVLSFLFLLLIVWAGLKSPISESSALFFSDPWGIVALVDLYIGFFLFILFLSFFESSKAKLLTWSVALLVLGNLVSVLYVALNFNKINSALKKA